MSDGGNWKEMFKAGCEGDLALLRYHVSEGVDLDYVHPECMTSPLVGAILAGQVETALFMLERGASPSLRSPFESLTPMQAARRVGLPAVEARLRALGADDSPEDTGRHRWWAFWRRRAAAARGRAAAGTRGDPWTTTCCTSPKTNFSPK